MRRALWRLHILVAAIIIAAGLWPVAAQNDPDQDVLAVITWNNAALPAAYRDWDTSGLGEYLTGAELAERSLEIQRIVTEGADVWSELRDFVPLTITYPSPERAVADTIETWYEWVSLRGTVLERTWTAPERYELWNIGDRWYIADNVLLAELPPFTVIAQPAPPSPPPPTAAPVAPVAQPTARPAPTTAPARSCCRVCTTGKACGNTCISASFTCRTPPGCACNGGGMPPNASEPLGPEVAAQSLSRVLELAEHSARLSTMAPDGPSRWSSLVQLPFVRASNLVEQVCTLTAWAKRGWDAITAAA